MVYRDWSHKKLKKLNFTKTIMSTRSHLTSRKSFCDYTCHVSEETGFFMIYFMNGHLSFKKASPAKWNTLILESQMGLKSIQNKVCYESIWRHNANTLPCKYAKFNSTKRLEMYYLRNSSTWTKVTQLLTKRCITTNVVDKASWFCKDELS